MQFILTTAGKSWVQSHPSTNPPLVVFKLGSASNYLPIDSATGLVGTVVYMGTPSAPVRDNNVVKYTIFIDKSISTFSFGEVGLYLDGGILFAVGALSSPVLKTGPSAGITGSSISLDGYLDLSVVSPSYAYAAISNSTACFSRQLTPSF
jgi:Phage tail-collar fibre protein